MSPSIAPLKQRSYRFVAPFYDALGSLYSLGAIEATRLQAAQEIEPGQSVLCVGAGTGREAAHALARGAKVTLLDASPEMMAKARDRLQHSSGCDPSWYRFIETDVLSYQVEPDERFDLIWASFFLNVFEPRELPGVWTHLASLVTPGGRIVVADFSPARGSGLARFAQHAYYFLPLAVFRLVTRNGWHGLYDYHALAQENGHERIDRRDTRLGPGGPRWFQVESFQVGSS